LAVFGCFSAIFPVFSGVSTGQFMPAPLEPAAITGEGPEPIAETPSDAEYRRIRKTVRFFVLFDPFLVGFGPFFPDFCVFLPVFRHFWTIFADFCVFFADLFGNFCVGFNSESIPIKFWSVFSSGEVINIWDLYSLYNLMIRLSLKMAVFDIFSSF
jgi:hypothetical protein